MEPEADQPHFAKPQDIAFLPDGRLLVADGLGNHRVVILDSNGVYLGEFGRRGGIVSHERPDAQLEVHAFSVDSEQNW